MNCPFCNDNIRHTGSGDKGENIDQYSCLKCICQFVYKNDQLVKYVISPTDEVDIYCVVYYPSLTCNIGKMGVGHFPILTLQFDPITNPYPIRPDNVEARLKTMLVFS